MGWKVSGSILVEGRCLGSIPGPGRKAADPHMDVSLSLSRLFPFVLSKNQQKNNLEYQDFFFKKYVLSLC